MNVTKVLFLWLNLTNEQYIKLTGDFQAVRL